MSRLRPTAAVGLLIALAVPACAQTRVAVNLTDVTVEQLTNGLRITVKADGLMQARTTGQSWQTNADHEFTVWLGNARSALGTFVDVSRYPVNYLKLDTPPDAREGVGLTLTVRLYRGAHIRTIELDNENYNWTWDWRPGDAAYDLRKGRSGKELVITVWSDRREILPADRKPRYDQGLDESLSVQVSGAGVDVEAVNVPLQKLMSEVAAQAGASIYVSDRVERLATLRLMGMPLERFVAAVADSLGLTATAADGAWFISDGLPSSLAPYTAGTSREIRLRYASADTVVALLPEFLLRYLRPGATQDSVVAHGPKNLLDRIEEDVAFLDHPARAVRITGVTVEASGSRSRQAMWSALRRAPTSLELDAPDGRLRIEDSGESLDELVARVQALDTRERVKVDVRPSLRVEQGQYASLFVGTRQFYQFLRNGYILELASTEAGVQLYVRPNAVGDDAINTYVALDVSTFRGGRRPPTVDTRKASATLLLGSGESMIIGGGLMDSAAMREKAGLPGLTGRRAASDRTREVVFLIGVEVVPERGDDASSDALPGRGI